MSVRFPHSPSLRVEATPPPITHRTASPIARSAANGLVWPRLARSKSAPIDRSGQSVLNFILARLVFCQALPSSARPSPPDCSYLPSLSLHPRQHRAASQLQAVSYDRPILLAVDVALRGPRALLELYEECPYAFRIRLRFALKRRLHQSPIERHPRLLGPPPTDWQAPI